MEFTIGQDLFSSSLLLGRSKDNLEIQRLIRVVSAVDENYVVHAPMPEDILTPNDDWECHDVEGCGIIFEFLNNYMCYISFDSTLHPWISTEHIVASVKRSYIDYNGRSYSIFSDISIIGNEKLLPNRYSPILDALRLE